MVDMIQAHGLVKRYKEVTALAGLDLAVPEGQVLALLGPNGAGKTTAVRVLTTLLKPDEGTAHVAGVDVRADPDGVRARIGLSGQYAAVDEHLTGFENLEMVGRLYGLGRNRSRARARELLERFGLAEHADKHPERLSGGQQQRAAVVRALCTQPTLLLLDEVTAALDPELVGDVLGIVRDLAAAGTTMVLATHEMAFAREVATKVAFLDGGRILEQGPPAQIFADPREERTRAFLRRVPALSLIHI